MIEDGPDTFAQHWRRFAAEGTLFGRPEGSPLLEVDLGGAVVQLLERTNPYVGTPGRARLLVQPSTDVLEPAEGEGPFIEVPWRGAIRAQGEVLHREGRMVVIDAGVPLLVDVWGLGETEGPAVGERVRFLAGPPIHGFVFPREVGPAAERRGRNVDEAP